MLSKFDDYPIHQTAEPIAVPASTDRNAYDRYWFNGYTDDGEFYFGVGAALYPNLGIMDCGFSIVRDGEQHAFHASRRAPREPSRVEVGPFRIEIIEPLRALRVVLDANETGPLRRSALDPAHVELLRGPAASAPPARHDGRDALQPVRALARRDPLRGTHARDRSRARLRNEGPLVGRSSRSAIPDPGGAPAVAGRAERDLLPLGAAALEASLHPCGHLRDQCRRALALERSDRARLRRSGEDPARR